MLKEKSPYALGATAICLMLIVLSNPEKKSGKTKTFNLVV